MTQSEYYLGEPGEPRRHGQDGRREARRHRLQRLRQPVQGRPDHRPQGERIRMYVLNAGPSKWSAFHVIGTVFDTHRTSRASSATTAQTMNLAPVAGRLGRVHARPGGQLPVRHPRFGDMVKGAAGMLHTTGAPMPRPGAGRARPPRTGRDGPASASTLGEMWIKSAATTVKAGKVTFDVRNTGAHDAPVRHRRGPGQGRRRASPSVGARQGRAAHAGGQSGPVSANLKPGSYELVCLMPGHYAAGQHTPFKVTG